MADDWWDRLYADADATGPQPTRVKKARSRGSAAEQPQEHIRVQADIVRPAHPDRERLRDAAAALLPDDEKHAARIRLAAYNTSAAAAGWWLGIEPWCADGIAEYGAHDVTEGVWVGVGLILAASLLELRSHGLRDPGRHLAVRALGWAARIPLASAVLALALYGPNAAL